MSPTVAQSTKSAPSDPKEYNKLLFQKYIQDLASDGEGEFVFATAKLTKFLAKAEAYYPEAHDFILTVLKTARATLTRLSGSAVPFVCSLPCPDNLKGRRRAYSSLAGTVTGFKYMFGTNEDVQRTLDELENSARLTSDESLITEVNPSQNPSLQEQPPIAERSSEMSNQRPSTIPTPRPTVLMQPNPTTVQNVPQSRRESSLHHTSRESSTLQSRQTTPSTSGLKRDGSTPNIPSRSGVVNASTQTSAKTKKRPKLNASKKTLLHTISQDDIKWYASKLGVAGGSTNTTILAEAPASPSEEIPSKADRLNLPVVPAIHTEDAQGNASDMDGFPTKREGSRSVDDKIIDLTSAENLTRLGSPESLSQGVGDDIPARPTKDSDERLGMPIDTENADVPMNVDLQKPDQSNSSLSGPHPSAGSTEQVPVEAGFDLASPTKDDASRTIQELPIQAPEMQPSLSGSSSVLEEAAMEISEDSMSAPELTEPATSSHELIPAAAPDYAVKGHVQSNGSACYQEPIAENKENHPLPVNGHAPSNESSEVTQPKSRASSPSITSVFEPQTVVSVSVNPGLKKGNNITIEFEVPSGMETLLSLWKTRFKHEFDLTRCSCISLACYSLDDLTDAGIEFDPSADDSIICSQLLSCRPSWPNNGTLRARLGNRYVFLSPPVQTTGDNFVDLAPYVDGRDVNISLEHGADLDNYIFALFAHPPTVAQLRDLQKRRMKDKEWAASLKNLSRPFTTEEIYGINCVR